MDKWKKFVEAHRKDFEIYEGDFEEVWKNIDAELGSRQHYVLRGRISRSMKIAASVALIAGLALAYLMGVRTAELRQNGIGLMNISEEMADTEVYYVAEINEKMSEIDQYVGAVDQRVLDQLEQLDKDYFMLKKDLRDEADNEEVIDAMIGYYRLKLSMLEQILEQIKEKNDRDEAHNI